LGVGATLAGVDGQNSVVVVQFIGIQGLGVQLVEFAPEADDALLEFLREFLVLGCELVRRLEMLDELVEGAVALDVGLDASELPCDVLCARLVLP
jgi:hypothetical protein